MITQMTRVQFQKYVLEQMTKAAADSSVKARGRLMALEKAIDEAAGFTGNEQSPIPITVYQDPDQLRTGSAEASVSAPTQGGGDPWDGAGSPVSLKGPGKGRDQTLTVPPDGAGPILNPPAGIIVKQDQDEKGTDPDRIDWGEWPRDMNDPRTR